MKPADEIWTNWNSEICDICSVWLVDMGCGDTKYIRADLVPQWQPIETAPKDGTTIDLWETAPVGGFRRPDAIFRDGRWIVWNSDYAHGFEEIISPTHWMPLPSPPA